MSFILDALKKSEKERQRSAVPGIGDLPIVVQHARPSAWATAIIAGLALAVVALGVAWWHSSSVEPVVSTTVPAPLRASPEPVVPPASATATATQPAGATTRSLANEATRIAEAARPAPATTPPPTTGGVTRSTVTPGVVTTGPMSIADARLAGVPVPELGLELLVFSNDPAKRFVYINSSKYGEGATLPEGPQIVEITTEGAILSYRGQRYLLPQN